MEYTITEIKDIVTKAKKAAYEAGGDYFMEKLDGKDNYPCGFAWVNICLLYTSPSPRDKRQSRMPSSA